MAICKRYECKDHLNNCYENMKIMCHHYGIDYSTFRQRRKLGWTLQECLEGKRKKQDSKADIKYRTDPRGVVYPTVKQMCEEYKINQCTYMSRIRSGKSVKEALQAGKIIVKPAQKRFQVTDHIGNTYESIKKMCEEYGLSTNTYYKRMEKGLSLQEVLCGNSESHNKKNKMVADHLGNKFHSEKEMCKHYNVDYKRYLDRKYRGLNIEKCLQVDTLERSYKSAITDPYGNSFKSINEMCKFYNIHYSNYLKKKRQGMTDQEIIENYRHVDKIECRTDHVGRVFKSVSEMCKFYDISQSTYRRRIESGQSKEEALTIPCSHKDYDCGTPVEESLRTDHKGNIYRTRTEMFDKYQVRWDVYKRCTDKGMTLNEILIQHEDKMNRKLIESTTPWKVKKLFYMSEDGTMYYLCTSEDDEEVLSAFEFQNIS